MSGLFGVWSKDRDFRDGAMVRKMFSNLGATGELTSKYHRFAQNNLALGIGTKGNFPLQTAPKTLVSDDAMLLVDGEFHSWDEQALDKNGQIRVAQKMLASGSAEDLASILHCIDGVFSFVLYSKAKKEIKVGVDKFGIKPIFYTKKDNLFVFSSKIKALIQCLSETPSLDMHAVSDFFMYSFILENRSLFNGISRLPPGSILSFRIVEETVQLEKYWLLSALFSSNGRVDPNIERSDLAAAFADAVRRRLSDSDRMCLALSGGLDSRAILAAMGDQARGISSYTMGVEGCADQGVAARLAILAGAANDFVGVDENSLDDLMSEVRTVVVASDGFSVTHDYLDKSFLDYITKTDSRILISGHGAEASKVGITSPVRLTDDLEPSASFDDCVHFIDRRACTLSLTDEQMASLFSKDMTDAIKAYKGISVKQSFQELSSDVPHVDVFAYWYLHTWLSRYMASALSVGRSAVEVRLPFVDPYFLRLVMRSPHSWRTDGSVQTDIIRKLGPKMMRVRNVNTGAPLDAKMAELILYKCFRKIASRLDLPGYRHYAFSDKWQRGPFSKTIRETLLSDRCLSRNIYDPVGLERSIEEYMSGDKSLSRLIPRMLCFEEWFRIFVDGEG